MMIFSSLRVTVAAEGGLKGPAQMRRSLQGVGDGSHQQASAGYIPAYCLPLPVFTLLQFFDMPRIKQQYHAKDQYVGLIKSQIC